MNYKILIFLLGALVFMLFSCSGHDDFSPGSDSVAIDFSLPDITATTRTASELKEGTTLRVLAYRHSADGSLSARNFVAENTYVTQADGSLKSEIGEELYLISGEYDFYAITPALEVNHERDQPAVAVEHLTDFASSVQTTKVKADGNFTQTVELATLDRKCSQAAFIFNCYGIVNHVEIRKIEIQNITLTQMADAPLMATGISDLPEAARNMTPVTMGSDVFTTAADVQTHATGAAPVLPKTESGFGMEMLVTLNDATTPTRFQVPEINHIAFLKGYSYNFFVDWAQDCFRLTLVIAPWNTSDIKTVIGSEGIATMVLGEWTECSWNHHVGTDALWVNVAGWTPVEYDYGNIGYPGICTGMPGWTMPGLILPEVGSDPPR